MTSKHRLAVLALSISFSAPILAAELSGSYGCLFTKNFAGWFSAARGDGEIWHGGVLEVDFDSGTFKGHVVAVEDFETVAAKSFALDISGPAVVTASGHANEYLVLLGDTRLQFVSFSGGASLTGVFPYEPTAGESNKTTTTVACSKI
jgi:hypothetical protein